MFVVDCHLVLQLELEEIKVCEISTKPCKEEKEKEMQCSLLKIFR